MEGLIFWIVVIFLIIVGVSALSSNKKKLSSTRVLGLAKDLFGEEVSYWYDKFNTGIVIDKNHEKVLLVEGEKSQVFNISQIRSYEKKKCDIYIPTVNGINANIARCKAYADARRQTGLFITVSDVEHPVWRISMQDENDQQRWYEILTQLFEGTLSIKIINVSDVIKNIKFKDDCKQPWLVAQKK